MALRTFVKVGNVDNLSDARYCAGMGVDLIGFNIGEVPPEKFDEITSWVCGVGFVIEDNGAAPGETDSYRGDFVERQYGMPATADAGGKKLIVRIGIDRLDDLKDLRAELIILDGSEEWGDALLDTIRVRTAKYKILLSSGINAQNVWHVVERSGAYGVALSAGSEIRPGYKDYDELADILDVLQED